MTKAQAKQKTKPVMPAGPLAALAVVLVLALGGVLGAVYAMNPNIAVTVSID